MVTNALVAQQENPRISGESGRGRHTESMTRMFVAAIPPDDVVEHLEEFLSVRRDAPPYDTEFRWTPAEHWHVAMPVEDDMLPDLVADRDGIMAHAEIREQIEIGCAEHRRRGVQRVVVQHHARLW